MSAPEDTVVWGMHTKDESIFFRDKKVAIGWEEMGDLSQIDPTRDGFKAHYSDVYPDAKKGSIATSAGELYRFVHEVKQGDYVVYSSTTDRQVYIGTIAGPYEYAGMGINYPNRRNVKWLKHVPRTAFTQGALYELGSALSLFTIKNYADEYIGALDKSFTSKAADDDGDETIAATAKEIQESTRDFILKELARNLKGYELEDFVAALLRAMGYRTTVSPHGGDSGIDISAYKDELPPRILVQVKSGSGNVSETTIQSLKGAMREGDYGLFVTLADYTKNANKYLEMTPIIRGINGNELVELTLKYYEQLDEKYRKIIPLKMVYIPVADDQDLA